jgi:hypothetical protein
MSPSNHRPWNVVAAGLQGRYTAADDEFVATVAFQYPKAVTTSLVAVAPPAPEAGARSGGATRTPQSVGML